MSRNNIAGNNLFTADGEPAVEMPACPMFSHKPATLPPQPAGDVGNSRIGVKCDNLKFPGESVFFRTVFILVSGTESEGFAVPFPSFGRQMFCILFTNLFMLQS
jgi:hypothetical protein